MTVTVDYYFSLVSPWTYLGSERFQEVCRRHGARILYKPVKLAEVFPATGGLPLPKRAPARQAYRLQELERWREFLGLPLNLQPKFFPADESLAARMVIAAQSEGRDPGPFSTAVLRAVWAEDRNIAERDTLAEIAAGCGFDAAALIAEAEGDEAASVYAANTQDAIDRGVFGSPTYAVGDRLFWGQDRIDFLEREIVRRA